MNKIFLAEIIGLIFLVVILIIPGLYAVGILSHEIYHYMQHSNYTQAFCISINQDTHSFIIINKTGDFDQFDYQLEQRNANKFSAIVTWSYAFVFLCTVIWLIIIIVENRNLKRSGKKRKKKK